MGIVDLHSLVNVILSLISLDSIAIYVNVFVVLKVDTVAKKMYRVARKVFADFGCTILI